MGRKKSSNASDVEDFDSEDMSQEEMSVKVEKAIKAMPSLQEKVQGIAINGYIIQKRALDKEVAAEINKIQVKNRKAFEPYLQEIFNIISGNLELTDADLEGVDHLLTEQQKEVKQNYYPKKSIDDYWQKVMLSHDTLAEVVQPDDEKVLQHLTKIESSKSEDGNYFSLIFHFSENDYFTNNTIKKQFQLEGEQIKRSFGTSIDWKQGKNLTMEIVKKKNKKKKTTTTKHVKKQSFFNIFNQVDLTSDNDDKDQEEDEDNNQVEELQKQFEVCNALYEEIIPKSLQFYLGVMPGIGDNDDMMKYLGDGGIEEQDESEEQKPKVIKKKKNKRKGSHSSKE